MPSTIFRAHLILPVDGPPFVDGAVSVSNGWIVSVKPWANSMRDLEVFDLGDVALIPSLVNAHTHLEFSHLKKPIGERGMEFTQWLREVIRTRLEAKTDEVTKKSSIERGLYESYDAGVGCLGEIATSPVDLSDYSNRGRAIVPMDVTVFHEQLGRTVQDFPARVDLVESFLKSDIRSLKHSLSHISRGISPHAPYSVHRDLFSRLIELSVQLELPVAMHVAETEDERQLLETQTGLFVEFLDELGLFDRSSFLPPMKVYDILKLLSQCKRSLVVHGNYLTNDELDFIGGRGDRMSIVFCPRTHLYFDHHRPYPLNEIRSRKIILAVGTDSRASNPDLNLFAELQTIFSQHPEWSPLEILEMGTLNGAKALGVASNFGALAPRKKASLSMIQSPNFTTKNLDWLLSDNSRCVRVL